MVVYFTFQQEIKESLIPIANFANASDEANKSKSLSLINWFKIDIECPGGVAEVCGSSDQNSAITVCSDVILFTTS